MDSVEELVFVAAAAAAAVVVIEVVSLAFEDIEVEVCCLLSKALKTDKIALLL